MNTSQPTPVRRAAWATARAWLPALAVTQPRRCPRAERRDLAERAAQLERPRPLQALGLQRDRRAGRLRQLRGHERRACVRPPRRPPAGPRPDRRARSARPPCSRVRAGPVGSVARSLMVVEGIGCMPYGAKVRCGSGPAGGDPDATGAHARPARRRSPCRCPGGITNHNFRVTLGGEDYVMRVHGTRHRRCSASTARPSGSRAAAAAELGIAPPLDRRLRGLPRDALRRLRRRSSPHEVAAPRRGDRRALCAASTTRPPCCPRASGSPSCSSSYAAHGARARRATAVRLRPRAQPWPRASTPRCAPCDPRPCHNDLLAGNLIRAHAEQSGAADMRKRGRGADADRRLGVRRHGPPAASTSATCPSTTTSTRPPTSGCCAPTTAAPPPDARRGALALMRILSDAREAAWGVVQAEISELDFDFERYARVHFERLHAAVEQPRLERMARRRSAHAATSAMGSTMVRPRELPDRARVVIIGGGVGGAVDRPPPRRARRARRRAARPRRADQRLDLPLRRARRPAALERVADAHDDGLRRALPHARLRLGAVRRHPPRVHARARAGGAAPGRLGEDLRAAARADLRRAGARAVPADEHRRRALRLLPAERRLPRPVAADERARRRRARGRLSHLHAHARHRHRRRARDPRSPRVRGVQTEWGPIEAEVVVNAGGMFAAEIGRMAGVRVPIVPFAHEYLVTQPFRERGRRRARRAPADAARPRPADLLPRGGRRPGHGRLRAPLRAVGARRAPARRDPAGLQRPPARRGLAALRGDRRQLAQARARDGRDHRHAADQRARGVHARQRVLPRRERGARLLRRRRLLRARARRRRRHRQGDGRVDPRGRALDRRVGDGHPPLRRALPLAQLHAQAHQGGL